MQQVNDVKITFREAKENVWRPEDHKKEENEVYIRYLKDRGFDKMASILFTYCRERGLV